MRAALLLPLVMLAGIGVAAQPRAQHAAAPAGRGGAAKDWSHTVTISSVGAFVLGNPAAPVKVIEFASYTCPHCAHISTAVLPGFIDKWVRPGLANYEFRNAIRDRDDLIAAALARCTGTANFFPATAALFASQQDWMDQAINYEGAHAEEVERLTGPDQRIAIARGAGLDSFFGARGLKPDQQRACLSNQSDFDKIGAMTHDAFGTLQLEGTPGIFINGVLTRIAEEPDLDAAVQAALRKKRVGS